MPDPEVSFVVLTYNFDRYLGDCLGSILSQDSPERFEVIVVDDASTDGTDDLLRGITDPRVQVIRHATNQGHIASVHDGLAAARGRFIVRVDGDDRYRSHFLRETLAVLARFPEIGVVYGDVALIDEHGRITHAGGRRPPEGKAHGNVLVELLEENFICSPTVIARRQAWLETLPVPSGLAFHDWYFTVMMARKWTFRYVDSVLADYRVHPANWHTAITQRRREEASVFWLLAQVYAQREETPALEEAKQRARRRIYGAQYRSFGDKYFGLSMDADARRCYLQAVRLRPVYLTHPGVMRRLAATYVGRRVYEQVKSVFKSATIGQQ